MGQKAAARRNIRGSAIGRMAQPKKVSRRRRNSGQRIRKQLDKVRIRRKAQRAKRVSEREINKEQENQDNTSRWVEREICKSSRGQRGPPCNRCSICKREMMAKKQWDAARVYPKTWSENEELSNQEENDEALEKESRAQREIQGFNFTKLPPEIRDMIFEIGLIKNGSKKPALLRAVRISKILYSSALPIYYRNNMHFFNITPYSPSKYLPYPPSRLAYITTYGTSDYVCLLQNRI